MKDEHHNSKKHFLCNECTLDKCICDEKCIFKCGNDLTNLKLIEELRIKIDNERQRNVFLENKYTSLNKIYNAFSTEFERMVSSDKEKRNIIENLQREIKIINNMIEMKNNELIIQKNDITSLKNEISLNNNIIKSIEYQNNELKKKKRFIMHPNQPKQLLRGHR